MKSQDSSRCGRCGATFGDGLLDGLCRRCLLLGALSDESEFPSAPPLWEPVPEAIRTLGDYVLAEEIGRGGMGVVYRARQRTLDREVAVKVLLGGAFAGIAAEARFRGEMLAAGRLNHPGIVAVHDVGQQAGQWYLVMEWVEGEDLSSCVARGVLHATEAARIGESVARAVQHAHERGVLHRDLKPSNILLDASGRCRVTDFGLAKRLDVVEESTTLTGQVLGSPGYLSPEQAAGSRSGGGLGPATDVYGLGATLYFTVTGRPPFVGAGVAETLEWVRTMDPVAPRVLNPAIPRDLETIVMRCLQREAGRRYRSLEEVADDLRRFQAGEPILARPVGGWERTWLWARRKPLAAAVVLLGVMLAVGGPTAAWQVNRLRLAAESLSRENRHRLAASRAATGMRIVEEGAGLEALPWLVDALRIDLGDPAAERIHRLRLGILASRLPVLEQIWPLEEPLRESWVAADGRTLITWHGVTQDAVGPALWAWALDSGQSVELARPPGRAGLALAVAHDRSALAVPESGRVRLRWRQGTNVLAADVPLDARATAGRFSADAKRFAVGTERGEVVVHRVQEPPVEIGRWTFTNAIDHIRFSTDGNKLLVRMGGAYARVLDLGTGRVTRNVGRKHPVTAAVLSPDGTDVLVATSDGQADIWSLFRNVRRFEVSGEPGVTAAAWAPGGDVVATAVRGGRVRIWTALGRRMVSPALSHPTAVEEIHFLPDGVRVVTIDSARMVRIWRLPTPWIQVSREAVDDDIADSARETLRADALPIELHGESNGVSWTADVLEEGRVRLRTREGIVLWISETFRAPIRALSAEGDRLKIELAGGGSHSVRVVREDRATEELERWATMVSGWRLGADAEREALRAEELLETWRQRQRR